MTSSVPNTEALVRMVQDALDAARTRGVRNNDADDALSALARRFSEMEEALTEAMVALEVLNAEIPYFRLGPLRKKIKALSPALEQQIAVAVEVGRAALAASPGDDVGEDCCPGSIGDWEADAEESAAQDENFG